MRDPIKLILARHAQRGTDGEVGNENLSPEGQLQAGRLAERLKLSFPNWRPTVLSSPKNRCIETAAAIGSAFDVPNKLSPLLDECHSGESHSQMSNRINCWLAEFEANQFPPGVIAVSHIDWLEEATAVLLDNRLYLRWMPATAHLFELCEGKMIHSGLITV
jgi:broad specificity phosphatase PhoE